MFHVWVLLLVLAMNGDGQQPNYGLVAFYDNAAECNRHVNEVTQYGAQLEGSTAGRAVCIEFDMAGRVTREAKAVQDVQPRHLDEFP